LREKFTGKPEHVVNFMRFVAEDMREHMARLGFRTIDEMVGRVDRLEPRKAIDHWKAKGFDFSDILYQPDVGPEVGRFRQIPQEHGLDRSLDLTLLLDLCKPAIERREPVVADLPIRNVNRVVGTITGSEVTRRWGARGLPDDTIRIRFRGSAGQSFGAFIPRGMTFHLEGDANDYVGKGLSGGKLVIYPAPTATFRPEENIIVGNVALYGATSGEVYIRGMAGERFCVRNSGAQAIVEGVGDHACEYMTGGRVVVLGSTGRNFGAGMSGGIAYVLDDEGTFARRVNRQMVDVEPVDADELLELKALIEAHRTLTRSQRAQDILDAWEGFAPRFVKVMPRDYKRMLAGIRRAHAQGLAGDEAIMVAFEENSRDLARVGGNWRRTRWASRRVSSSICASFRSIAARSNGSRTGTSSISTWRRSGSSRRPRVAWIAACPSATRARSSAAWRPAVPSTT
jgi:glutamate synthase (ferredoxin)